MTAAALHRKESDRYSGVLVAAMFSPAGTLAAHWQAAAMLSTGKAFRCRELIQAGLGAALEKARHELGAFGGKGVVVVTGSLHAVAAAMKQLELA